MLESMQKIAILYDASQAILSTFDLDEVLNRILTIIRDFFQLQNGAVLLLDKSRQELQVRAHLGRSNLRCGLPDPQGHGIDLGGGGNQAAGVRAGRHQRSAVPAQGGRKPGLKWQFR